MISLTKILTKEKSVYYITKGTNAGQYFNPDTRKYLIIDNIIKQYLNLQLDKTKFPKGMPKNLHWSGYAFHSEPNKNKLPPDLIKRKNALLIRENKKCFRY